MIPAVVVSDHRFRVSPSAINPVRLRGRPLPRHREGNGLDRFRSNTLHQLVPRESLLRKYVAFVLNMATEYRNNLLWHSATKWRGTGPP